MACDEGLGVNTEIALAFGLLWEVPLDPFVYMQPAPQAGGRGAVANGRSAVVVLRLRCAPLCYRAVLHAPPPTHTQASAQRCSDAEQHLGGPDGVGRWNGLLAATIARRNRLVSDLAAAYQVRWTCRGGTA